MKRLILTTCTAAFLFVACNNDKNAEEKTASETTTDSKMDKPEEKKEWIPVDSARGMQAMMEAGTPGEPHKMIASSTGSWNAEMTHWMGEGAPPMKGVGKSVNTMIYGGRYLQSKFNGDMMGAPFEGTSIMGYDNTEKKYFSNWIDSWSTAMMTSWGTWDDASKSMTLTGTMKNPANGLECHLKEVFKIVDDNTQVMEMYGPDPKTGKEYKMMEIKYTKK